MHSLEFIIQPYFFLQKTSILGGKWERLVLGLNPLTLHCGSAVICGRELHFFLLSFPKVLSLIQFKDCTEGLGCWAGAALHLSRSLLSSYSSSSCC